MGTPRTMRSARWKRDANSLIFSHVAVSAAVIDSPEIPLYLASTASESNSGRADADHLDAAHSYCAPRRRVLAQRRASLDPESSYFTFLLVAVGLDH
jgi:hypothetical protein